MQADADHTRGFMSSMKKDRNFGESLCHQHTLPSCLSKVAACMQETSTVVGIARQSCRKCEQPDQAVIASLEGPAPAFLLVQLSWKTGKPGREPQSAIQAATESLQEVALNILATVYETLLVRLHSKRLTMRHDSHLPPYLAIYASAVSIISRATQKPTQSGMQNAQSLKRALRLIVWLDHGLEICRDNVQH